MHGFSYCIWLKLHTIDKYVMISSRYRGTTGGFRLMSNDNFIRSHLFTNNDTYWVEDSYTSIAWNHFCSTWIPTTLKFYKNGNLLNSGSNYGVNPDPDQPLGDSKIILGAWMTDKPNKNARDFALDEFIFWPGDVLSDAEISDLYNSY